MAYAGSLLEGPIELGHHLPEGAIQTDLLRELEIESGVLKQMELEHLMNRVGNDRKVDSSTKKPSLRKILAGRFCDALEKGLMRVVYGSSKPTNNYAPVEEFAPERVLSIRGSLPVSPTSYSKSTLIVT
jgi:hypothetical protein